MESWDVSGLWKAVRIMLEMSGEVLTGGGVDDGSGQVTEGEEEEEITMEMFKACANPGRKKSLRSLEIPLDNLLSGIIYTAGGRDKREGPVLLLTQPRHLELDTLIEITDQDFFDMLAYFTSVPSESSRCRGFSVVVDGEVIHDFLLRIMLKAMATMQAEENIFHVLYFVSSVRDISKINWKKEFFNTTDMADLPFQQVNSYKDLHKFVDAGQLTSEFGGNLSYSHQDWVRFRMQVEPFLCDCISISKRLARVIEPFTDDSVPSSIEEVEETIQQHHLIRRKTLEVLHIDDLEQEGTRIDKHMHHTASNHLASNPDFSNTLATISDLLNQITNVKDRVETLWSKKNEKLQTSLKQRKFVKEAGNVIEWFEVFAEEFFETHTELGDSLNVAQSLVEEVHQFEDSTKRIINSTKDLVVSGSELEQSTYTDRSTVNPLMGKIKQLVTEFDTKLSKRKKKLDDSVRLHRLTEAALDWCIESAAVLSGNDMLTSNHDSLNSEAVKAELDRFLASYPPPTDQEVQLIHELTEAVENQWIKENAVFAYNRVVEVKERFKYHHKMLEELISGRKQEEEVALQVRAERERVKSDEEGRGEGRTVKISEELTLLEMLQPENEPDSVFLATGGQGKGGGDEGGGVVLRPPKNKVSSLHYDDTGVDHALMLLKTVAVSADAKLHDQANGTESTDFPASGGSVTSLTQHISKQDISNPTRTAGPLFSTGHTLDSDEEDNLQAMSSSEQREKIKMMPCPIEDSLQNQTKSAKHRRKLMEELIQTEETYIRDMEWVVEHYMPAMDDIASLPRNLVGKKNLIFSTIPQLLQFNKLVIFPQLRSLSKCPVKLGQIFMTLEEDLLNYSLYFKNLPQQTRLMEEGGIEFFTNVSHSIGDRFFLNSYLIKPFQRITKYKIFLEEMIKYSSKSDLKGKLKEYYDKLKEAQKMVDFILRHGNDLLAVECLRGYEGNMREHGKILRQGDLILVEYKKHHRKVFLFEHTIILAKQHKSKQHGHEVSSSDIFHFKEEFKTSDYGLRENVDGHPNRFQLYKKKDSVTFQAETVKEKNIWVQDIWDLFFSHMLNLKDQNLEAHGSRALTSIAASGTATIGRSFGHTLRRAMSVRHSRDSRNIRGGSSRPSSNISNNGSHRLSGSPIIEESTSPSQRHSGTFVNLRPNSMVSYEQDTSHSDRSSIISTSSISTIGSAYLPASPVGTSTNGRGAGVERAHHLSSFHKAAGSCHESPSTRTHLPISPRSSTGPSPSVAPPSPSPATRGHFSITNGSASSSSSSLDSQPSLTDTTRSNTVFNTPV